MAQFGENGAVRPVYADTARPKLKRLALAIFLCGITACLAVTLISAAFIFVFQFIGHVFSPELLEFTHISRGGFGTGLAIAAMGGAFNWFFGYLTIPAAWIALGFSIGRFPRRGIVKPAPYYRWGAIWGALLVAGVTGFFSALFSIDAAGSDGPIAATLGGLIGGAVIGALAGLICGGLFRLIVRPASQLSRMEADVFS